MAGDTSSSSPFSTCTILFFSLLLFSHFTMAVLEHRFSPLASIKEGAKKRNTTVVVSVREGNTQNSKKDMALGDNGKKRLHGPKRGRSRFPRQPLKWKNRIFNASEHEVPSGPNPISNR